MALSFETTNSHSFVVGEAYTRRQIHEQLGGGLVTYLPRKDGRVVCACLDPSINPEAPAKVLVGNGDDIRAGGRQFAVQRHCVPIFVKRTENEWVYIGDYKVASMKNDAATLLEENRKNGKTDITAVLYLERSPQSPAFEMPAGTSADSAPSSPRPAYLLTWNPEKWDWKDLDSFVSATRMGEIVRRRWSTGGSWRPGPGDRAFLLVQGQEPRGIIGAGYVASAVYEDKDWDDPTKTETYVQVDFEIVLGRGSVLSRNELLEGPLGCVHWDAESSGNEVKPKLNSGVLGSIVPELERTWIEHLLAINYPVHPVEIEQPQLGGIEGKRKLRVHWYKERDPRIMRLKKQQALELHGELRCEICAFVFRNVYAPLGDSFIECHHTVPIASLDEDHETKLEDLALLCSNCHRMIHSGPELLTLERLRAIVETNKTVQRVTAQADC